MPSLLGRLFFSVWIVIAMCRVAPGADFRVENLVFSGDQKKPSSRSLTLFHQGFVYDFLQDPPETTVLDKSAARFVILDNARHVRTEATLAFVDSYVQKMKKRAAGLNDRLINFFAEPVFLESFNSAEKELRLKSPLVKYRVIVTMPETRDIAAEYREFSDQSARLNAILVPGSRPPFARLKLNDALARYNAIPLKVVLTIASEKDPHHTTYEIRSEHRLSLQLSPADLRRIESAEKAMGKFKLIGFERYCQTKR
ncbi:MAG: hypothetical protein ACWGMZ_00025 [Thermoguttaceae bacterium]